MWPGQRTRQGTRTPPSKVVFFVPRYGLLISSSTGPLSLVKTTSVLSLNPCLSIAATMRPTASSRHFSMALADVVLVAVTRRFVERAVDGIEGHVEEERPIRVCRA